MTDFPNSSDRRNAQAATPVWTVDWATGYYLKPNADGSLNISGIATATLIQSLAFATAAAPGPFTEGTDQKLSQDLHGNVRTRNIPDATVLDGDNVLTVHSAAITAGASGPTQIIAADATHKIRVLGYMLTSNGNVNAKFQSATTDITGLLYLGAHTGVWAPFCAAGWFQTNANEALNLNLSGAQDTGGHLLYALVP